MDPTKARINEIDFIELCSRLESIRHKPTDIKIFLAGLNNILDFDITGLYLIVDKIFTPQFAVQSQEILVLLETNRLTRQDLAQIYNKSLRTIDRYKIKSKNNVLYPRLTEEEQICLNQFMELYNKFLIKDYKNLNITIERKNNNEE